MTNRSNLWAFSLTDRARQSSPSTAGGMSEYRKQALSGLLAKVEAGEATTMRFEDCGFDGWAELAYSGSLDAALMLHNAVLPGCSQYSIQTDPTCIKTTVCWWPDGLSVGREAHGVGWSEDNPARALLIAILKALIAGEDA